MLKLCKQSGLACSRKNPALWQGFIVISVGPDFFGGEHGLMSSPIRCLTEWQTVNSPLCRVLYQKISGGSDIDQHDIRIDEE